MSVATADGASVIEEENLPFLARVLNHILTPGSSLTPFMWVTFNVIMAGLFAVWLMFLYAMPANIHVWSFGFLGLGLGLSTNWFMSLIFSSGLDFASQQQQQTQGVDGKKDD